MAISQEAAKSEAVGKKLKGLKGKELADTLASLSESGLMTSELIAKDLIEVLKKKNNP